MKKIILFICLFLTGCSANYNISVDNDYITESIDLAVDNSSLPSQGFNEITSDKNSVYLGKNKYYDVKYEIDEYNFLNAHYKYKHKIDDFINGRVINWCYHDKEVINNDEYIIIDFKGPFDCANREAQTPLEFADINIITDLEVVKNNADKVNGNKYIWQVDGENYVKKPIYIKMKKKTTINGFLNKQKDNSMFKFALVILSLFVVGFVLYLYFRRKYTKKNSL